MLPARTLGFRYKLESPAQGRDLTLSLFFFWQSSFKVEFHIESRTGLKVRRHVKVHSPVGVYVPPAQVTRVGAEGRPPPRLTPTHCFHLLVPRSGHFQGHSPTARFPPWESHRKPAATRQGEDSGAAPVDAVTCLGKTVPSIPKRTGVHQRFGLKIDFSLRTQRFTLVFSLPACSIPTNKA